MHAAPLRNGWDLATGGFYDEGCYPGTTADIVITYATKTWWAQAEDLDTLLLMADRYPNDPLHYQQRFLVTPR